MWHVLLLSLPNHVSSLLLFTVLVVTGVHGWSELHKRLAGATGQVARPVPSACIRPLLSTLSGLYHIFQLCPIVGTAEEKEPKENELKREP